MKSDPCLFPEKDVPRVNCMSAVDSFKSSPWRSRAHDYDVDSPRRYRDAPRPRGYFIMQGAHVGYDPAGTAWPYRDDLLYGGICIGNDITTCRIMTHVRIKLTVPNVTPADRGRPVFCGAAEGPASLDPAVGGRIGYIIRCDGENRALVQIIPGEEEFVDMSISKSFYPVETADSRAMKAEKPFNTPRVRRSSSAKKGGK